MPWKQTDMDDANIESTLELSQHSVTIVLVSMDQNRGDSNEPVLEVNARLETAVTGDDLRRGIADTLGIPSDLVEVEPVQTRRRRLLSNDLQLGHTSKHPRGAFALKEQAQGVATTLIDVVWQLGKSGVVSPVAILDPIDIGGATVSRATLHNIEYIRDLNLEIGCRVEVIRSGEIIPRIVRRIEK